MFAAILSRGNLRQAFERVQISSGCRGADGMTVGHFAADLERELDRLQDRFLRRCYRPYPLLQISVPKRNGGERLLRVPTVRDRVAQTAVDLVVRPIFEAEFEDCSFAFRKGRSVRDAVRKVCELREQGYSMASGSIPISASTTASTTAGRPWPSISWKNSGPRSSTA